MENVEVIDNFLPDYIQDQIENIINYGNIKYEYSPFSSYDKSYSNNNFKDEAQLVNNFIEEGNFVVDDMSHFFLLPLQVACLKNNIQFSLNQIIRTKVNLKFRQESKSNTFINPPHRDTILLNSLIGIYYINDSDGDTIIYKGNDENNLKPIQNISPKKGRMILMDGLIYHSASHPLKTKTRKVINYNLKK
jgi:hypothetical protein|tara:strand:- start:55 stop:627 length:573 start_codon:yes stop_codon:yes gene_type:complete